MTKKSMTCYNFSMQRRPKVMLDPLKRHLRFSKVDYTSLHHTRKCTTSSYIAMHAEEWETLVEGKRYPKNLYWR